MSGPSSKETSFNVDYASSCRPRGCLPHTRSTGGYPCKLQAKDFRLHDRDPLQGGYPGARFQNTPGSRARAATSLIPALPPDLEGRCSGKPLRADLVASKLSLRYPRKISKESGEETSSSAASGKTAHAVKAALLDGVSTPCRRSGLQRSRGLAHTTSLPCLESGAVATSVSTCPRSSTSRLSVSLPRSASEPLKEQAHRQGARREFIKAHVESLEGESDQSPRLAQAMSSFISRARSQKDAAARDRSGFIVAQLSAVEGLLEQFGADASVESLANGLLSNFVGRDGAQAFSQEQITHAIDAVRQGRGIAVADAAPTVAAWLERLGQSVAPEQDSDASTIDTRATLRSLLQVLELLRALKDMDMIGMLGQILWHHRKSKSLQLPRHREVLVDLSWVAQPGSTKSLFASVERVFRAYARLDGGGRMRFRQWQQLLHVLLKCPLLENRLPREEVDAVFFCNPQQKQHVNVSIDSKEFAWLLAELAERVGTHPSLIFALLESQSDAILPHC